MEVGAAVSPALRVVDLWAAGRWLTTDDNTAYVPSFTHYMRLEADRVRRGDLPAHPVPGRSPAETMPLLGPEFWFLRWNETVDNVSTFAYLDGDLVIMFEFWRPTHPFPEELGRIFVARLPPAEFTAVVEEAADFLDAGSGG